MSKHRSELDELYPTPKTYGQMADDQKTSEQLHAMRMPRHIAISTSLRMYSIWIALGFTIQILSLALSHDIFSGVFLCFLLGLAWVGYAVWMTKLIIDDFSRLTYSANLFFFAYYISFPVLAFMTYTLTSSLGQWLPYMAVTGVHFLLSFILIRDLYKLHKT